MSNQAQAEWPSEVQHGPESDEPLTHSGMFDKDFANWLLTQLEKRRLTNPEREWFDEYMTRNRSKLGRTQQKPWVSTLIKLGWGLAVALTLGLGALTWLI